MPDIGFAMKKGGGGGGGEEGKKVVPQPGRRISGLKNSL